MLKIWRLRETLFSRIERNIFWWNFYGHAVVQIAL